MNSEQFMHLLIQRKNELNYTLDKTYEKQNGDAILEYESRLAEIERLINILVLEE